LFFFSFSFVSLLSQASCQALHLRMHVETKLFMCLMLVCQVHEADQRSW
jgi:hypothetical protein